MRYWDLLKLEPTKDKKVIKHRYAELVKIYHPEDDPEGFENLRSAYESALEYARQQDQDAFLDVENEEESHAGYCETRFAVDISLNNPLLNKINKLCVRHDNRDAWQTFLNSSEYMEEAQKKTFQEKLYYFLVGEEYLSFSQMDYLKQDLMEKEILFLPLKEYLETHKFENTGDTSDFAQIFADENELSIDEEIEIVINAWINQKKKNFDIDGWKVLLRSDSFQRVESEPVFLEKLYHLILKDDSYYPKIEDLIVSELKLESAMYNDTYRYAIAKYLLSPKRIKSNKNTHMITGFFIYGIFILIIVKVLEIFHII